MTTTTIQHQAHRGDDALPRRLFSRQMAASLARQTVGLDAAALRRRFPLPLDPSVLFQAMERGKQRSRLDLERPSRGLEDALGDRGAMERLQFERPEDEQVQGALDERGDGIGHR